MSDMSHVYITWRAILKSFTAVGQSASLPSGPPK
jgi:hypothetical protein